MNKTYVLKLSANFHTLTTGASSDKSGLRPYPITPEARAARQLADAIAPRPPVSPKPYLFNSR